MDCGGDPAGLTVVLKADGTGLECTNVAAVGGARYGIDLSQKGSFLVKCQDPGCDNCAADHTVCSTCKTDKYLISDGVCVDCGGDPAGLTVVLKADGTGLECVNVGTSANKYGNDLSQKGSFLVKCQDPGCDNCAADHTVCSTCKTDKYLISDGVCGTAEATLLA